MRKEFEMSEKDCEVLMEAMKPVPMIALQCGSPEGPQESANAAWESLGRAVLAGKIGDVFRGFSHSAGVIRGFSGAGASSVA